MPDPRDARATTEPGAEGRPQLVLPGAERRPLREVIERRMAGGIVRGGQRGLEGMPLFDPPGVQLRLPEA